MCKYTDRELVAVPAVDDPDDTVSRLYVVLPAVSEQRRRQNTVGPVAVQNHSQPVRAAE